MRTLRDCIRRTKASANCYGNTVARVRIGELLVTANVISEEQLAAALAHPRGSGERLGDVLVHLGYVDETVLTQALSQQLSVPWVSLYHIDFSRQLLDLVPRRLADEYCLIPVMIRKSKQKGDTLYVAMDDPTHELALSSVSRFAEMPARPMIACRSDIQNAIRVYYATGSASQPPKPMARPPAPPSLSANAAARIAPAPLPTFASEPPSSSPPSQPSPRPPPSIPAQSPVIDPQPPPPSAPGQARNRPMVALTLLDGTTINLPSRKSSAGSSPAHGEGLTARDLISALRAVSHGADASEILGEDAKWQSMFAALLSLMLRKGLIADWEFVEEYRKI